MPEKIDLSKVSRGRLVALAMHLQSLEQVRIETDAEFSRRIMAHPDFTEALARLFEEYADIRDRVTKAAEDKSYQILTGKAPTVN